MKKPLYGVGINDSPHQVHITEKVPNSTKRRTVWECPYYCIWSDLIRRTHCPKFQNKNPTYKNTSIVPEWYYFSNFYKWASKFDITDKHLDKDLLIPNNKVYGPTQCMFVPYEVNVFINTSRGNAKHMLGTKYESDRNKFCCRCVGFITKKRITIGRYLTEADAHKAWQRFKIRQFDVLIERYKSDSQIHHSLVRIRDRIQYELENGIETTHFQ